MPSVCIRSWLAGTAVVLLVALSAVIVASAEDNLIIRRPIEDAWRAEYRRDTEIPFPADNPYSESKAALGRLLFFEPLLSGSGSRSCSSCHTPALSWGDGLQRSVGEGQRLLPLRSPTLLNVAWSSLLGWDGKFPDLESVAFTAITSPANMHSTEHEVIARLAAIPGYQRVFERAFPGEGITRPTVERALATFQRTLVSGQAPFDRWVTGDENAVSEIAKRGFAVFNNKAGCAECHRGWAFTDGSFHDVGVALEDDLGRGRLFPTSTRLRHAFKVPTLRDVDRRAPYMHDGSVHTLDAVVELYDRGGVDRASRSRLIQPLGLTPREKAELLAFLATLSEDPTNFSIPVLPR